MDLLDLINESKAQEKETKLQKERDKKKTVAQKELAKYLPYSVAIDDPAWYADSQTVQIIKQTCDECKNTISYVGGCTLHYKHKRLPATRELNAPLNKDLRMTVRYHKMTVPMCACCLKVVQIVDEYLIDGVKNQMELF